MKSSVFSRGARLVSATALAAISTLAPAGSARADATHTVARGHTLEAISHRYHVTVKAILEANHLRDGRRIQPGDVLVIPGIAPAKGAAGQGDKRAKSGKSVKAGKPAKPPTYAMRPRTPGVLHAIRLATSESFTIRLADRRGKTSTASLKAFERMMRATNNLSHPPEGHLVSLMGAVSNHFGSRPIQVISGFRPYASTQRTPHSNHNIGRAIDFRVVGVPNEVVRDFCRTLRNVGVGYYPNSTFVHLDVREAPAYWVDYSKPGELPRYNSSVATTEADEGTSDVTDDVKSAEPAEAALAPAAPSSGSDSSPPSDDDGADDEATPEKAGDSAADKSDDMGVEPPPKAIPEIPGTSQ